MAVMLTTEDNPYDPRTEFAAWYAWDVAEGYNTCAYLDRVTVVPDDFPEEMIDAMVEQVMDEIISIHDNGLYKKLPIEPIAA